MYKYFLSKKKLRYYKVNVTTKNVEMLKIFTCKQMIIRKLKSSLHITIS